MYKIEYYYIEPFGFPKIIHVIITNGTEKVKIDLSHIQLGLIYPESDINEKYVRKRIEEFVDFHFNDIKPQSMNKELKPCKINPISIENGKIVQKNKELSNESKKRIFNYIKSCFSSLTRDDKLTGNYNKNEK